MFFSIGVFFGVGSRHYSIGSSAHPGPGYFPLLLSIVIGILGLVIVVKALTLETRDGEPIGAIAWKPLLAIVCSIVVFGVLLPRVGLGIAMLLLVGGSSLAGTTFKWADVIFASAVMTAFSWLAFIWGLGLPIPMWPSLLTD